MSERIGYPHVKLPPSQNPSLLSKLSSSYLEGYHQTSRLLAPHFPLFEAKKLPVAAGLTGWIVIAGSTLLYNYPEKLGEILCGILLAASGTVTWAARKY